MPAAIVFAFLTPGYWLRLGPGIPYGPERRIRCCRAAGSFGAADSAMIPEKYFARKGNCFQLKAGFRIFRFSPVFAAAEDGKGKATADRCASPAAIIVHRMFKQAGSFIPLHR
jgi:hypothetical protein